MPRKPFVENADLPFHISARCINREWFDLPLPYLWELYSDYLFFVHEAFGLRIHSFVLMNNHFHLLASSPKANLSEAMTYFMRETSRAIGHKSGRINQIYGGRFHRSLINSRLYFLHAYKYVYRNPIEANIVNKVEEYKYSTLQGLLGLSKIVIPLEEDQMLFQDIENQLKWINSSYAADHREQIRKALKRNVFKFSKDKQRKESQLNQIIS